MKLLKARKGINKSIKIHTSLESYVILDIIKTNYVLFLDFYIHSYFTSS